MTSTTKSPFVVVNFTRNTSGALARSAAGFRSGLGRGAAAVPDLVAGAPVLVAVARLAGALGAAPAPGRKSRSQKRQGSKRIS